MVDVLADPAMVGFKRGKPIYQIIEPDIIRDVKSVKEDYKIPYKSSKIGCL